MTETDGRLRFAVALSRASDPEEAARTLVRAVIPEIGAGPIDLAFLFCSSHYATQAEALALVVRETLGPSCLVGCTGEGVIAGSEEIEAGAAVTLWAARLPHSHVTPLRLSVSSLQNDDGLSGWPEDLGRKIEQPCFLLLADPFSTPMNEALSMIADRCPGSPAIGGLAGGGRDPGENRMFLNDQVFDGGLVGVALSGPVSIRPVISQGCRPIGDRFVVTKADRNIVYELGGTPALERLQAVFESLTTEDQQLAQQALHVGMVIDEHGNRFGRGDFLVRNLIGADRNCGSLAIGDLVEEGQTLQFHVRDADSATEDLSHLLTAERARHQHPPLAALLFSCCGRGRGLFGRPHHDIRVLRKEAGNIPVGGFFAQGEIGPVGGSNFLHGYTASVALFSESTCARKSETVGYA